MVFLAGIVPPALAVTFSVVRSAFSERPTTLNAQRSPLNVIAPRRSPGRPAPSSPPPRWRSRSRRSCPSTARAGRRRRAGRAAGGSTDAALSGGPGGGIVISPSTARCGSRRRASSVRQRVRRHAALARFAADVDLDEDARRPAARRGVAGDGLAQRDAVDGVNEIEDLERARRLVALQVADQMPAWPRHPPQRASPPPPARSSRRCRARRRRCAARTNSAGFVFDTAISRTPAASRPARAAAAAMRAPHGGERAGDDVRRASRARARRVRRARRSAAGRSARAGRGLRRSGARRRCCTIRSTRATKPAAPPWMP